MVRATNLNKERCRVCLGTFTPTEQNDGSVQVCAGSTRGVTMEVNVPIACDACSAKLLERLPPALMVVLTDIEKEAS